ncbi:hypothetical protein ACS0TY_009595 [Phlomoides rotata]
MPSSLNIVLLYGVSIYSYSNLVIIGQEKEYKEAMEAFQEKNNEKAQLTSTLVELVTQSEKFRMRKLEELSKIVNSTT